MITPEFFNNFMDAYLPNNNIDLKQESWGPKLSITEDNYIEFARKKKYDNLRMSFYAKYENNKIKIKVIYFYFNIYMDDEYDVVKFHLIGLNENTYDFKTIDDNPIHFIADQEILKFIKQFDYYILDLQDKPILKEEYDLYIKHLKNKPELIDPHESKNCFFKIDVYFENIYKPMVIVKVTYESKINKAYQYLEYALFRNRIEGYDFNDQIDNDIFFEISQRIDEIYYDFQLFFLIL